MNPEIEAMSKVDEALVALDDAARARVLRWAGEKHGVTLAPAKGRVKEDGELGEITADEYPELGDLFSAAAPRTADDRALVVGFWFQVIQENGTITGHQVNTELKNLGHGVRDVTAVFSSLIGTSPQLVIQTRKAGSSRQARKQYKLTKAGINRVHTLVAGSAYQE
jgi:hypothetical protein